MSANQGAKAAQARQSDEVPHVTCPMSHDPDTQRRNQIRALKRRFALTATISIVLAFGLVWSLVYVESLMVLGVLAVFFAVGVIGCIHADGRLGEAYQERDAS